MALNQKEDIAVSADHIELVFMTICCSCQRLINTDISKYKPTYINLFLHAGCPKTTITVKTISENNNVTKCQTIWRKGSVKRLASKNKLYFLLQNQQSIVNISAGLKSYWMFNVSHF